MKVQMGQTSGVSCISAQANRLSSDDVITNLDECTVLGQVGVSRDRAVYMANFYPVRLAFARLAIAKLHAYLSNHTGACCGHCGTNRHGKVVGILVGTLVTTG